LNRVSHLVALADHDPLNPVLLCDLLDELLAHGLVDEASARLIGMPVALRYSPGVRFREARCAVMRGDASTAAAVLQPLVSSMEDVPAGVIHDLAYAQFAMDQYDEAWQTLATTQGQGADAVALALLKARILHRQRKLEAALEVLASVAAGQRKAEVRGLQALLWLDAGDLVQAGACAGEALQLDPDQHEAGIAAGTLALWSRNLDESATVLGHVVALHPESGRAWLGLGEGQMLRGAVPEARAMLERASSQMPDHIGTWHALAWCQLLEGDLAGAKRSFNKAFVLDRTFGETHGGFALVHALRGEREEAEASIKRAMRLDPQGRSARYAQSVLMLDDGRPDEARAIVAGILARTPGVEGAVTADFIFKLRDTVRPRG